MIETRLHDDVLEIIIGNPPVNVLGVAVRQGLVAAFDRAEGDAAIRAIVIRGGGKLFSAGADVSEFGKLFARPPFRDLVERIEACTKPVVAAIHGVCFGGGCEVILACHYRVAAPSARIGLPEVKLGLIPGAGGTQRLPRLTGVEAALRMIVTGDPVSASEAEAIGLVDKLVNERSLADEAIVFARAQKHARRTGDMALTADAGVFGRFAADNAQSIGPLEAPLACIDAIRVATQSQLAEGLEKERALFADRMHGDQSRALRHIFFAERAAARIDDLPEDMPVRPVGRVGVVGAGAKGSGIAADFLSAGFSVHLTDMRADALERGIEHVHRHDQAGQGRLIAAPDLDALAQCDLVIEATDAAHMERRAIFARLGQVVRDGAILVSGTACPDIDDIALSTARPGDVLGMNFFPSAHIVKLLEVTRGARTSSDVLATAMSIARRIGRVPVATRGGDRSIGERLHGQCGDQVARLLREGVTPLRIARIHGDFGMPADLPALAPASDPSCERTDMISDEEIVARTLYMMVNEAALILEQAIVQRASDIDVAAVHGVGWPRWRGGPMCWADTIGLDRVVAGLERFSDRFAPDFRLSVMLKNKARAGQRFLPFEQPPR